jgi:hypothetical protein
MAEIQWFVVIKGRQEGPYTISELFWLEGVTPDTLAWREGMKKWKPIRAIPELQQLFKDKEPTHQEPSEEEKALAKKAISDEVLAFPYIEPPWLFWLLFLIILCAYGLFRFLHNP